MKSHSYESGRISFATAARVAVSGLFVIVLTLALLIAIALILAAPVLSMGAVVPITEPHESTPVIFESSAIFLKFAGSLILFGVLSTAFGAWLVGRLFPFRVTIIEKHNAET